MTRPVRILATAVVGFLLIAGTGAAVAQVAVPRIAPRIAAPRGAVVQRPVLPANLNVQRIQPSTRQQQVQVVQQVMSGTTPPALGASIHLSPTSLTAGGGWLVMRGATVWGSEGTASFYGNDMDSILTIIAPPEWTHGPVLVDCAISDSYGGAASFKYAVQTQGGWIEATAPMTHSHLMFVANASPWQGGRIDVTVVGQDVWSLQGCDLTRIG